MKAASAAIIAVVSLLGLLGCAPEGRYMSHGQLLYWTKFYEKTYSTRTHAVRFIEVGEKNPYPWCAWSISIHGEPMVAYDLNCERGMLVDGIPISEKILARHEVFHEYLGHHDRLCERDADDRPVYRLISAGQACIDRDQAETEVGVLEQQDDKQREVVAIGGSW